MRATSINPQRLSRNVRRRTSAGCLVESRPMDRSPQPLARNVIRLSHLDLPGAGQVTVAGDYAYVGHIPNKQRLGTSFLYVRDPKNPRGVSQVSLRDPESHRHKARVVGGI